ncbi:tripartite tricarboxylate transporter substrate binding protein [Mycobacterium sp. 236(2023)]|uniref:Bug family tripartite tricarboxylate transporter substrate binding protein n=1 Tax=Mycobacterium sp. 236(2023) TaxID=3038163 RepID=UPI002414DF21|nr:tripartite tricarboxylate transporter substrate binding protein [Mycobacterium sp. 236(2023)]MDG4668158.1 tripartite tricarboxylate transporter substrate binding protein [Mycobacterium sp. 236(2023)]
MNKSIKTMMAASAAVVLSFSAVACGPRGGDSAGGVDQFRYMVPNAAGSGWDTTARTAAKIMEDDGISQRIDVFNVDGANGTVGLSRLMDDNGNGELVMQMGFGLVAATVSQNSSLSFDNTTPLVKLLDEYLAVVVPKDSPINNYADLVAAWKKNPRMNVGGGSAIGGADNVATLRMAEANGIPRADVNYVTFGGSGVLPAVLGNQVDFAVFSAVDAVEQVNAGELKAIAVTGGERFDSLPDVPTLKESGTDVVVANWRGVVAPPGVSDEAAQDLIEAFDKMHQSQAWKDAVERNGWVDAFMTGDEFGTYLNEQAGEIKSALEGTNQ